MRRSWSRMVSRLFRTPLAKPVVRRVPSLRIESLEDRVVPASFDLQGAGVLGLDLDTDDSVSIVVGATDTTFTLQGGGTWTQIGGVPVSNAANILTITNTDYVNSFAIVNTLGDPTSSTNFVTFSTGAAALTSAAISINLNDTAGNDNVIFNGGLLDSGGTVEISVTGAISSPNGTGADITANLTRLSAATGIGAGGNTVSTSVAILEAIGGTGDINIANTTSAAFPTLTIGGAGGLAGVSSGPGATITITNDAGTGTGNLIVDETVTAGLSVSLQAAGDLTTLAKVDATAGSVSISAPNGLLEIFEQITATGGAIDVTAKETTVAGPVIADSSISFSAGLNSGTQFTNQGNINSSTGNVTIRYDSQDLSNGVITVAADREVNLRVNTGGIGMDLGSAAAGANFTQQELNSITGGQLRLTSAANVDISAAITLTQVATLVIEAGFGSFDDGAAGSIAVAALNVVAANGVNLDNAGNDVDSLSGRVTGDGADFIFTDADGFTIDTVYGIAGIATTSAVPGSTFITLTAGGAVTQTAGANVTGPQLSILGAGPVTLDNTGNDVATVAAALTGSGNAFSFTDADTLTIGTVNGTSGISATDGAISVNTVNGTLTVNDSVNAGTGTVQLIAGSAGAADNALTIGDAITGTGGITFEADNIDITANVDGGTSTVRLDTFDAATAIDLGGADDVAVLGLTDGELDLVAAGVIVVGNTANTANISVTAPISPLLSSQLELETGASIVTPVNIITITETRLGLTANALIGAVGLPLRTQVSNLEAVTNLTNGINVINSGTVLTIGGVNATLNGVRALGNAPISITNDANIVIGATAAEGISTAGGSGGISVTTSSNNIVVNAAVTHNGTGEITINAEDDVIVNAAISAVGTGAITIIAEPTLGRAGTITTNVGGTITAAGGDIRLEAMDNVNVNDAVAVTAGTGSIAVIADARTGFSGAAGNFNSSGLGTLTTFGGNISIQAGDSITVGGAISAGGAGSFTAAADAAMDNIGDFRNTATIATVSGSVLVTANDINIQANVSSTAGGDISLLGTTFNGGDVNITTGVSVASSGGSGNILIQADAESDLNGTVYTTGTGTIVFDTDLDATGVGELQINDGGGLVTEGGDITFRGQDLDILNGQINAGAGRVTLLSRDLADLIELGTEHPTDSLGLTDADLDQVTASVVQIGSTATNTGGIAITAQISLAPALVPTLSLETGGAITDPVVAGVPDITVDNLALRAGTGIGSADDIDVSVSNLAAINTTTGNILIQNTGDLTLARGIDGLDGITNNAAGVIDITTEGTLFIDSIVQGTGGGDIVLAATGADGDLTLTTSGNVVASGGDGNIVLSADGQITINNSFGLEIRAAGLGDITLDAGAGVDFLAGTVAQSGNTVNGGDIVIRANVGNPGGGADITLAADVNITTRGNAVLNTDPGGVFTGVAGADIVMAPTSIIKGNGNTVTDNLSNNILLRADGDITVARVFAANTLDVQAADNIIDAADAGDAEFIQGTTITLHAGGLIGGPVQITPSDVFSGNTGTPSAAYRAAIDYDLDNGGTLTVVSGAAVVATGTGGNVQLRQVDDPLDANPEPLQTSDLNVAGASINTDNQLALISSGGNFLVDSGLVAPTNADLLLATTAGFSIVITGGVTGGPSADTILVASGSTTAAITGTFNGVADVVGPTINLITTGGGVGTSAALPLEINATRLDGQTNANGATAGGDAFITDTANGLAIGQFNVGTAGDVTLTSLGNLSPTGSSIVAVTHNDNIAEIIGDVVSLNATGASTGIGGQIGLPAQFFEVNSNVLNASTNNSNLWIAEVGTGATAGTAIGLATLGTSTGNTTAFLRVRNGGTITSATGDLGVADVVAPVVNLSNVVGDTPTGGGFGNGTGTDGPLEIDATTLNSNLPNEGSVNVSDQAGGLTVQRANTTAGIVYVATVAGNLVLGNGSSAGSVVLATDAILASAGSITSAAPAGVRDVTAQTLGANAAAGIATSGTPLETAVEVVDLNGGTGGAFLTNAGGLRESAADADLDITITTVDTAATGEDLEVRSVISTTGNVTLQAGDNFLQSSLVFLGASISAANGTVTIVGDFGNADAGVGATVDVQGPVVSGMPASVLGGTDNDTFNINVGASDTAFDVNGNAPVFPTFPGDTLNLDLTGVTNPVLTPTGTGAGTYDFGNKPSVTFTSIEDLEPGQTISGTIFLDANRNGVRNANELPVAGNTVHLDRGNDGTDDEFTLTDANGFYSFPNQTPGTYSIRFDSDPNFVLTTPNPVVVGPLDTTTGLDFGTFGRSLEVVAGPTSGSVILRDAENGTVFQTIVPFVGFIGTVTTAVADVNGDGYLDAITGAGPGGGPHVKVFSGRDFTTIVDFFAYDNSFRGGVYVAAGDLNGDGRPEIITGAGQDGGPHVKVFIGGNFLGQAAVEVASFFAYDPSVRSGVHVGAADVNGDGVADIITGAREGFAPHVKVFDPVAQTEIRSFFAYDASFSGGVFVAGGDLDGDGFAEIITGSSTDTSHVKAFSGQNGSLVHSFFAFAPNVPGVSVGVADKDNDGMFDILAGSRIGSHVRVFDGATLAELDSFLAFAADLNGVFVGGA